MRTLLSMVATGHLILTVSAQQPQAPFKSGTEVVAIEVTVVDANGNPVPGLSIGDFDVRVDGRPRSIQSAQFIRTEPVSASRLPREESVSTNQLPTSGRLLLLVVDESNLRPGASVPVIRAAEALLDRLSPGDFVGVARIPDGGGVEFTHDRARVRAALQQITGRPPRPKSTRVNVYLSEAADYEDTQRIQWPAALRRECGDPKDLGYAMCVTAMQAEAHEILRGEELMLATFTGVIRRLIETAGAARAPVTMVVISESLFVGRDTGALTGLASAAAFARVSLNVLRPLGTAFGAGNTGFSSDAPADEALRRAGLERLAAEFRGGYYEVSSTGAAVFDRLSREWSGYYLLGVEATENDRRSRARPLRVSVRRTGVMVRSRAAFALPPPVAAPANPTEQLREMLKAPAPDRGLPMTLTSYAMSAGDDDRLRLLISAEIGGPIATDAMYHVGLLTLGPTGDHILSSAGTLRLAGSRAASPAPALFTTSVVVKPGYYSIRLAAIDADGRAGSVHHIARATLRAGPSGLSTSDLIVASEPPRDQFPVFNPSSIVDGPRIAALIELVHDQAGALDAAKVRFELAGHHLPSVAAPAARAGDAYRRTFSMATPIDLPAGEYEIRAVVTPGQGQPFVIGRAFRYEPPAK